MDGTLRNMLLDHEDVSFYHQYNALSFCYQLMQLSKADNAYKRLVYNVPGIAPISYEETLEQLENILFDRDIVGRCLAIRHQMECLDAERKLLPDNDW